MAVRSVSMRSLNRQRANVVLSHLLEADKVLSPLDVAQRHERVFEFRDGVLRGARREVLGWGRVGVGLGEVLAVLPSSGSKRRSSTCSSIWSWSSNGARVLGSSGGGGGGGKATANPSLARLLRIFDQEPYVLWFDAETRTALIVLKQDAGPVAQVKAWAQALMLAARYAARNTISTRPQRHHEHEEKEAREKIEGAQDDAAADAFAACEAELRLTLERARDLFDDDASGDGGHGGGGGRRGGLARQRLEAAGWDLSIAALETRSGSRLQAVGNGGG
ncbi:uncharacterized protein IWZ02DRAFT_105436 [Phyllosticta citriasiana]|uniref:Root UVB sensitive protein C-terminal domain-containing protein n=1 Tax=Phyllosticta citriasiana TaxID=595635 RepID=A0ABR1KC03_9PEZI